MKQSNSYHIYIPTINTFPPRAYIVTSNNITTGFNVPISLVSRSLGFTSIVIVMGSSCIQNYFSRILLLPVISLVFHMQQNHGYVVSQLRSSSGSGCDIYDGNWVFDSSYPLYKNVSDSCPFIIKAFDCLGNSRPDTLYLQYRWKPNNCELARFDGQAFLQRFRGKSIMFVGDSLSLNQWQSLICMLHVTDPKANYTLVRTQGMSTFTMLDYNIKVMLTRNALLVDVIREKEGRVLKLDSIQHSAQQWIGIDMLIFNTWHWWLHTGRKQPWDLIEEGGKTYQDMDRLMAYEKALTTWGQWVDSFIDPSKTKVYFQGVSPDHDKGAEWGEPSADHCLGQNVPYNGSAYPGGSHPAQVVLKKVLSKMSKPVHLLDITKLSQLRKDGHPSAYGLGGWRGMDCTHWCLAGVPDTWNQLLYASL